MPSRKDFKILCVMRLKEAKSLYSNGFYNGAIYLSGYIIETALKARICKILNLDYPSGEFAKTYHTHDFDRLIVLAGLQKELDSKRRDIKFNTNWSLVTGWKEIRRYESTLATKKDVEDILNAMEDNTHGILTWIKRKW